MHHGPVVPLHARRRLLKQSYLVKECGEENAGNSVIAWAHDGKDATDHTTCKRFFSSASCLRSTANSCISCSFVSFHPAFFMSSSQIKKKFPNFFLICKTYLTLFWQLSEVLSTGSNETRFRPFAFRLKFPSSYHESHVLMTVSYTSKERNKLRL